MKHREKILPDLIGRLTDDSPDLKKDAIGNSITSIDKYKNVVLRDLLWLLNSNVTIDESELEGFEYVRNSTLVFGMRSLAGLTFNDRNKRLIIQEIKSTIAKFERRIDASTLKVDMTQDSGDLTGISGQKLKIRIQGELLPLQMAEKIYLKTEIDVETGKFELVND